MKITPDLSGIMRRDGVAVRTARDAPSTLAVEKPRINEHTFGEAISLTQVSNLVVQKALTISMQLKNMASHAIATGSLDNGEVSRVLTEIGAALGKFGEQVTTPSARSGQRSPTSGDFEAARELARSADEIARGRIPGDGSPGALMPTLRGRAVPEMTAAGTVRSDVAGELDDGNAVERASSLSLRTSGLIVGAPDAALAVQGNIARESARRLLR